MIIKINETDVTLNHEVKTDAAGITSIHVTATVGDVTHPYIMTVGGDDTPLPAGYDLQKDVDAARQRCAAMAEGKARAKKLAASLT